MIKYTVAATKADLEGILQLQEINLPRNLSFDEMQKQGFVTVRHSYDLLKKLNDFEPHVIAKDDEKVVGYVLAMTAQSKLDIPVLLPMFQVFETILYEGRKISEYNYLLVGQVCVDKDYRGRGIFDNCYAAYQECYKHKYDFAITEIANTNYRSLHAHKRIGFKEIYSYTAPDNTEWTIVLLDWRQQSQ